MKNSIVCVLQKVTNLFIGILLLLFAFLFVGYLIAHFNNDLVILPFILVVGIFIIYQTIVYIYEKRNQKRDGKSTSHPH